MAFRISPLQIPDAIRPAQFDFKSLAGIGDAIAEARQRQALNNALVGATDAQGNIDYNKAGTALAQIGMLDQARPFLTLAESRANRARTEGHQAQALAETTRHNKAIEGLTGQKIAQAGKPPAEDDLDDETVAAMAEQYRKGDASVFTNLGRGAQGAKNVIRLRREVARQNKEAGATGADQAATNAEYMGFRRGQSALGQREAGIEVAATEFKNVVPIVVEASNAVNRTNFPSINKIIQAWQEGTGDPNIVAFGSGLNSLVNLYARAISPTGNPTVSDKDHAREVLQKAWSQGQFGAAVGIMQKEVDAALASPAQVRKNMRGRFTGKGEEAPPAAAPAAPAAPERKVQNRDEANQVVNAVRARLRELIAGGADPAAALEAANARLRALGAPLLASP